MFFKLNSFFYPALKNALSSDYSLQENISDRFFFSYSLGNPVIIQLVYSSKLTADSPTFYRDFQIPKCHFQTLEIFVATRGEYVLWSESTIRDTYGYIYKYDFNALKPSENLLLHHDGSCNEGQFKLFVDLEINTRYVLVVTTRRPNAVGNFSISISGPNNVTLNHISKLNVKNVVRVWNLSNK